MIQYYEYHYYRDKCAALVKAKFPQYKGLQSVDN